MSEEKRKFDRLKKPLIISYKLFDSSDANYDVTQLKDISLGGMRFITSQAHKPDTIILVELRIPFMEERIRIKGSVIESKEVTPELLYDTRVHFIDMGKDEQEFLTKIINLFLKKTT